MELPTTDEVALEVRSGDILSTTDGERIERHPGDLWMVPARSVVRIQALGQHAVLRAVYLVKEPLVGATHP